MVLAALLAAPAWTQGTKAKPAPKTPSKAGATGKARGAKPAADTSPVLVRFGKEALTEADVQKRLDEIPEQYRSQYSTPEGKRVLLERMVEERIWLMTALDAGVDQRPEVRSQIERQRRDVLVRTYVNEVMTGQGAPSDSEIAGYYEAHREEYRLPATVTVSHLQTKSEADGKRMRGWLAKGQKWEDLVQRYSTDSTTRKTGGRLGTVTAEGTFPVIGAQPALAESAFALGAGRIGGPYRTEKAWHLLRVESVVRDSIRPLEAVRPMLQRQLTNQRQQEYYKNTLDELRRKLQVREDSSAIRGFLSAKKNPREAFEAAQRAGTPAARIAAYEQLLAEHPQSEVSPQAQFMVGFVYSEELKDYEKAEAAFKRLLERYPKSDLAASARWMLEHMRTEEAPEFMKLEAGGDERAGGKP
jgi:tetratricopeptide (TPR) repeat protein